MHAEKWTAALSAVEPLDLLDDPQAASASAQQVSASAITRSWGVRCGVRRRGCVLQADPSGHPRRTWETGRDCIVAG
jgi:hypothetical protein